MGTTGVQAFEADLTHGSLENRRIWGLVLLV
jgi:hypothetical protein